MRIIRFVLWLVLAIALLPLVVRGEGLDGDLDRAEGVSGNAPRMLPARSAERPGKKITAPRGTGSGNSSSSGWWTTAAGLMVVLAILLGGLRLFKKHLPGAARFLPPQAVQVLGKRPLDFKQSIYLLRCGSKILIVGSSPQGMTTLGEITEPVEVDYLAGLCLAQDQQSAMETFSQVFRQYRPDAAGTNPSGEEPPSGYADTPRERTQPPSRESRFVRMTSSTIDPALEDEANG